MLRKSVNFIRHFLLMALLFAIATTGTGCNRLLVASLFDDPAFSPNHPYFYGAKETIKGITDDQIPFPFKLAILVDLPFELVGDIAIEMPLVAYNDIHRHAQTRKELHDYLDKTTLLSIFERGLQDKKEWHLIPSDPYYKAFKKKYLTDMNTISARDIDYFIAIGGTDKNYLARYLDFMIANENDYRYATYLLRESKHLNYSMLPVYRYLLSHSLKPAKLPEENAVFCAVLDFVQTEAIEQNFELVKLLLKNGCNPNVKSQVRLSHLRYPYTQNPLCSLLNRNLTALDLACEYQKSVLNKETPDDKAVKNAKKLIRLLQKYDAKHSTVWINVNKGHFRKAW